LSSPFVLIPTHTTRHLACCLASLAHQTRPPQAVVVTCDTDDAAIGALLDEWWPRVADAVRKAGRAVPLLVHTYRPHQGRAQLNQVRNNGLRALRDRAGLGVDDVVVVLDGDTMLAADALERHAGLATAGAELIIPYRFMIEEVVTPSVEAADVLARGVPRAQIVTPAMERDLAARDRRYRRHLVLARLGLAKPHKPKLIGGHHAVKFGTFLRVNGFDEEYVGYRFNDDDLSRRLRLARPRVKTAIAVREIEAYHLWHPVRAPDRLQDAPGYARWSRRDLPVRCVRGIERGLEQPEPVVREVGST
jgi:hypothetical protein